MSFKDATGEVTEAIVQSEASPAPELLLVVRSILQSDQAFGEFFTRFRDEARPVSWLRDVLAPRVAARVHQLGLGEAYGFGVVLDVCQYLADEYYQLGEGYFIVSEETGRVQLVATDEDLVDPGLLPRESGRMAPGLRRLHPSIEQKFILGRTETAREEHALEALTARAHQTELLRQDGDRRLLVATRKGRTSLARELSEDDPLALLRRAGGSAAKLLRHFELRGQALLEWTDEQPHIEGMALCRSTIGVQDLATLNLGYNRLGVLRSAVPQGWLRDIARQLSYHVQQLDRSIVPIPVSDLDDELLSGHETWVTDPDVYTLVRRATMIPVEGSATIGLSGAVGTLVIMGDFGVETREASDRWEVTATLPYRLYVDFAKIQYLPLVDIPRAAALA